MEKNLFREVYKQVCGLALKDCPPSSLSGLLHGYLSVYSMVRVYPWLEDEFEGPWDIHERVREIARMIQELLKDGDIPVDTRAGFNGRLFVVFGYEFFGCSLGYSLCDSYP